MDTPAETTRTRPRRYAVALLAVLSGLILLVGVLVRPVPRHETAPPPPSEMDLMRLARLSQRRSLEDTNQFFSALAAERDSVLWAEGLGTTGVLWRPDLAVLPASRRPLPSTVTLASGAASLRGHRVVSGPHLPIAAYELANVPIVGEALPVQPILNPGDWLLAVWRNQHGRSFATGAYLETVERPCANIPVGVLEASLPLNAAMSGAAVFDLDGHRRGIVAHCGDGVAVLSAAAVDSLIARGRSVESRLLATFGFRAESPSLDEAAHLKITEGALVREVWNEYAAALSGLRPGDVIRAIGERSVAAPADLEPLLNGSAEPVTLTVQRGARPLSIVLAESSMAPPERPDVLLETEREGYRIDSVVPGSAAFRAGLRAGDRLLRINHVEPRNVTHVRRLLAASASAPAFVEVEREGRRFVALISSS